MRSRARRLPVFPSTTTAPSASTEPFIDQLVFETHPDVSVTADGAPLSGALVYIRRVSSDGTLGPLLVAMMTDQNGHATGTFTRSVEDGDIEAVIIKAGYEGPLPADAAQYGEAAPAARVKIAGNAFTFAVELSKKETP